ncbi:IBR domain protein [Oesophagostomum dentatum]|uniref:IBR domain protein n=1 Tax=Oesophagostomum dentatum TaxID=61180 RepID=A0A0B1T7K4_OESDE|nr:IBR domain protein [Oesophagostomum dentatum]
MGDVATCPRVVCQKPAAVSKVTQKLATCLVCSFSFCIECQRAFHGLQPCPNEVDIPGEAL